MCDHTGNYGQLAGELACAAYLGPSAGWAVVAALVNYISCKTKAQQYLQCYLYCNIDNTLPLILVFFTAGSLRGRVPQRFRLFCD